MKTSADLKARGLVKQSTSEEVFNLLDNQSITFYCGFDPTADSLHVGSLLPLITMLRLKKAGHTPLALVGGATALIGDPSFKKDERGMLSKETVESNLVGIRSQINKILGSVELVNNFDWFKDISFLDLLRNQGKCFTINSMIAKDSVKERIEDPDRGISFTEFSYMIMQAEDFRHLLNHKNCVLQIGGSDQWGNLTAGIELVRKMHQKEVFGLTLPLLLKANGQKFGKTENGNVWLDSKRTSVTEFFQFFLRTDEKEVVDLLKKLTFLSLEEIKVLEESNLSAPQKREAQKALAKAVTTLVHGKEEADKIEAQTQALFSGSMENATPDMEKEAGVPLNLSALLVALGLCPSLTQSRKDMAGGAIRINGEKVTEDMTLNTENKTLDLLISKGKGNKRLVRFKA